MSFLSRLRGAMTFGVEGADGARVYAETIPEPWPQRGWSLHRSTVNHLDTLMISPDRFCLKLHFRYQRRVYRKTQLAEQALDHGY
jgi:hypothetical protein